MSLIIEKKKLGKGLWVFAILVTVLFWGVPESFSVRSSIPDNGLKDKVGLFFWANNRVVLALDHSDAPAERRFNFGKRNPAWNPNLIPLAGDFLGTGKDSVGLYIRRQSRFILHSANVPGWPQSDFEYSPIPGAAQDLNIALHPLIGDWDGDGVDTVGLYRRDTGEFFLRNENTKGPADLTFTFGTMNSIPIAGDWDGNGIDTVGVYNPSSRRFELADENTTETELSSFLFDSDVAFPIVGDWDGDGIDTVGVYEEKTNLFHLKNTNTEGASAKKVQLGGSDLYPTLAGRPRINSIPLRFPIAGNWNTTGNPRTDAPYEWETATPVSQNIKKAKLTKALQHAATLPHLHSLLVIRNGKLVVEEYFNGFDKDSPNSIKSCTKVFTSALAGIAIDRGYLESVDLLVKDFLPDYITAESHPWKHKITIHHLLNMRSGIDWDNQTWNPRMNRSSNWVKYYLDRPMDAFPGKTFQYASGCPNTIATILHRIIGKRVDKFAEEILFAPLGIKATRWDYEPNDGRLTFGPCEIFMQPRDMARMGELYLNDGFLDGRQIVPKGWVAYSKTDHGDHYGNYWWHHREGGYFSMAAQGFGGQRIYVTPALNLVVVTTSSWLVNHSRAKAQATDNFNL